MKISELRIPSTDGVHDLYAKLYEPDETPKALVQIVHGMVELIAIAAACSARCSPLQR